MPAVSLAHADDTQHKDALRFKYIAAYLPDGNPFIHFFLLSKAEVAPLFGFSSPVSVRMVSVRVVSQRRTSAQQERAAV